MEDLTNYFVEAASRVALRRGKKFIVEAETIKEAPKHRIVMFCKALIFAERVGNPCQRLAEIGLEQLLVGDVVGNLAKSVHIVAKGDQPRWVAGQFLIGVAHEARSRDLVERANVRQARGSVAGLEDHRLAVGLAVRPALQQLAGFLIGPGLGSKERQIGYRRDPAWPSLLAKGLPRC